jgi:hypothetical protein
VDAAASVDYTSPLSRRADSPRTREAGVEGTEDTKGGVLNSRPRRLFRRSVLATGTCSPWALLPSLPFCRSPIGCPSCQAGQRWRPTLFNFAESWIFALLPPLLADRRRPSPSVVIVIWLLALGLTHAFLAPYMAALALPVESLLTLVSFVHLRFVKTKLFSHVKTDFDQGYSYLCGPKSVELLTTKLRSLPLSWPLQDGLSAFHLCRYHSVTHRLALHTLRVQPVRKASAAELSPLGIRNTAISTVSNGA